jgi:predicted dehydrogenase
MKKVASAYNTRTYSNFDEMISDESVDAVSICVANKDHCEYTVKALEAGKHVLCEKPMATTLEECEKMVLAAKKANKYLMIGHNQRLAKSHQYAKELIDSGAIGDVISFKTSFGHSGPESWAIDRQNNWFFDESLAAFGAIADLGIHKTDLIQFLTDTKICQVIAVVDTLDKKDSRGQKIKVDDNTICIYRLSNGAIGTMTVSWTYYGEEDNSTVVYGTKGIMHVYDNPQYGVWIDFASGEKAYYKLDQIQTNDNQTKSGIIDLWIDSLTNQIPPSISGEDALNSMKAIFGAIQSAKEGKMISIQ